MFVFRSLDIQRDWGHVKDYIEARWLILQEEELEDFAIVTGITTPIREFVRMAFAEVGLEFALEGVGVEEVGTVVACNNPEYKLPIEKKVVSVDVYNVPQNLDSQDN